VSADLFTIGVGAGVKKSSRGEEGAGVEGRAHSVKEFGIGM
jgi:hypothetical protein